MLKYLPLLILFTLFSSCKEKNIKWVKFKDENGKFELKIPEGFETYSGTSIVAFGLPEQSIYWRNPSLLTDKMGVKLLSFSYVDLPEKFKNYSSEKLLDSCVDHFSNTAYTIQKHGRVISNEKFMRKNYPGQKITAIVENGKEDSLFISVKILVAENMIYTLLANGYQQNLKLHEMDYFQNSFILTDDLKTSKH